LCPFGASRFAGAAISTLIVAALLPLVHIGRLGLRDSVAFVILFFVISHWMESPVPGFELELDSDEIRVVRDGSVKRTVSRDGIRFAFEFNNSFLGGPGLVIFEKGLHRIWPLGGISIPKDLSEYDEIKSQVMKWLSPTAPVQR
jgi:hypothetical protein